MTSQLLAAPRTHCRILGLGVHRPPRAVANSEICEWIESSEEWIVSRSGIRSRRFAGKDETLEAMAVSAGRAALRHAGVTADRVGCVVVASMSNLVQTPPLAVRVAHDLGALDAGGFDVSGACAGFCHALAVAADMVSTGQSTYVLVIGSERMTDIVDPTDRTISFLFADGAGAVLVGPSDRPGIGPAVRGADGASREALRMNTTWDAFRADPTLPPPMMKMDGRRVFRWAVEHMVPAGLRALAGAGIDQHDLAAFIPHQANIRMIEILAAKLELPDHVAVAGDVAVSGNTSAASIPLAMDALLRDGLAPPGGAALLLGFGAGLNYAGQVVLLP
ncbi:3-oxoacyl-ACP synthase [Spongiactinospora gelatinilytica]|uniref:3-oxoacyl-ACP synthase n=1 Tax=Spongiactinospora gelatinilytica TaxID=2666298 RepID=A0A2W2H0A8_9ACTN|nr:beta-ketoacyl-ACP synthase 3 [Spongiactinospora gelatinilytica]PZG53363.1 3-oxoacyl-ACP synthase [Spongiactinospora gelatinilytica]